MAIDENYLASEQIFLGLSGVFSKLSSTVKVLNDNLSSSVKKLIVTNSQTNDLRRSFQLFTPYVNRLKEATQSTTVEVSSLRKSFQLLIPEIKDLRSSFKSLIPHTHKHKDATESVTVEIDKTRKSFLSLIPESNNLRKSFQSLDLRLSGLKDNLESHKSIVPEVNKIKENLESPEIIPEFSKLGEIFKEVGDKIIEAIRTPSDLEIPLYQTRPHGKKRRGVKPESFEDYGFEDYGYGRGSRKEGFFSGLEEGSLSGMVRGLIQGIKDYKAVAMLTTITTAAMLREFDINKLRIFTDHLESGTNSLSGFKAAVSTVSVSLGEDFDKIAERAADVQKDMNLAFDSKVFGQYLMVQGKVIKATGLNSDTLNKLFLSVKTGSSTEKEFIDVSEKVGNTLMALSGKAGVTKTGLDEFARSIANINQNMIISGASQNQWIKAQTQMGHAYEEFGKLGLGPMWLKIQDAIDKAKYGDGAARELLLKLGVAPKMLVEALQGGDYEKIIRQITGSLTKYANPMEILYDPNFRRLVGDVGDDMMRQLQSLGKQGKLTFKTLFEVINQPVKPNRLSQILGSIVESLKSLKNSFYSVIASLGEEPLKVLSFALKILADHVKDLHTWFQKLPESTKRVISGVAGISLAVIALVGSMRILSTAFKGLFALFGVKALVGGIAGLFAIGPIGWVIAAVVAVGTASLLVYKYWGDIKRSFKDSGPILSGLLSTLNFMGDSVTGFFKKWKDESEKTNTVFKGPLLSLRIAIIDEFIKIGEYWDSIWESFSWEKLASSFMSAMSKAISYVKDLVTGSSEWLNKPMGKVEREPLGEKLKDAAGSALHQHFPIAGKVLTWGMQQMGLKKPIEQVEKEKVMEVATGVKAPLSRLQDLKTLSSDLKKERGGMESDALKQTQQMYKLKISELGMLPEGSEFSPAVMKSHPKELYNMMETVKIAGGTSIQKDEIPKMEKAAILGLSDGYNKFIRGLVDLRDNQVINQEKFELIGKIGYASIEAALKGEISKERLGTNLDKLLKEGPYVKSIQSIKPIEEGLSEKIPLSQGIQNRIKSLYQEKSSVKEPAPISIPDTISIKEGVILHNDLVKICSVLDNILVESKSDSDVAFASERNPTRRETTSLFASAAHSSSLWGASV